MNKKAVGTIAIAAALIAALAVPVFADAGLRNGRLKDKRAVATANKEAKKAQRSANKASREASRTAAKEERKATQAQRKATRRLNKAQKKAQLEKRISNKLGARKHRFDAVNANLTKRINRIASLATTVAAAGGDVTAVNAKLDSARAHLATALALEQEAIAKFNAIPSAADRRAAFFDARAKGREAVAELKLARFEIRDAAQLLRSVVEGLRAASEPVDAQ
jgi:chromosome segregation ATPase